MARNLRKRKDLTTITIMKNILLAVAVIFFAINLSAQGSAKDGVMPQKINWVSLEEAQELTKKNPKKIMIDVYTSWCGPCKMMTKNTFQNPDVIKYVNKNFYAVKFNAETPETVTFKGQEYSNPDYDPNKRGRNGVNQFSRYMRVSAYPTVLYLDEELNLLYSDKGYKTPQQIELYLKFFNQEDYKEVTTTEQWQAYQAKFVPSFQEKTN